jgi:hypothetical protein
MAGRLAQPALPIHDSLPTANLSLALPAPPGQNRALA